MPRSLPPLLLPLLLLLACEAERLAQQESNKPRSSPFPVEPSKSFPRGGGSGGGRRWQRAYMKVFGREGHYRDGATGAAAAAWLDLVSSLDQTSPSLRGTRLISAGESRHEMGAVQPKMPAAMETSEERDDNSMAALVMRRARSMRGRRGTVDNQKGVKPKRKRLGKAAVDLRTLLEAHHVGWEAVPRPLALNQSTHSPLDTTRSLEFTFLDTSFRDTTSLVPLGTEEKALDVKNPFYPMGSDSYRAYAIMCVSIVIFTVGIIGNIAIMCIVCHNYYMRSISNSLLANLALWDFLIIFFCLPMATFHELTKQWLMGDFSCKIIPYLEVASLGVTTFTLCALCIDRFRAATNVQMYYEMIESCASTTAKLAVIWVGALLLALPELLIRQLVTEEGEAAGVAPCQRCALRISPDLPDGLYVLGLTYEGARLWWCFGCYFCLPTLFTIGSSLATARKIRQAERAAVRGSKKQIRLESQMNCTVVALAILYGLCVVPENVCGMVAGSISAALPRPTLELLQLISQTLLFLKSALTPALLLCLCRPFGRALLECCCCCCGGGGDCGGAKSSAGASEDNDHECTTELELSPFSTIRRDASTCAAVGTRC